MAGAPSAAASATSSFGFPPATSSPQISRKPPVYISSLSSPFPSKRIRRKNHLRQKILRTLESPVPGISPIKPIVPVEETNEQQSTEFNQIFPSETTGFLDRVVSNFSTMSFKTWLLYLVGGFIFQTIVAVLILGFSDSEGKDGSLDTDDDNKARDLKLGVNGNSESKLQSTLLLNGTRNLLETKEGGMALVDESEMHRRIAEIQEMAREAREREKLEAKEKGLAGGVGGGVEGDADLIAKSGIEKEVDSQLVKMRKKLEKSHEKLPSKLLRREGEVSDKVDKGNSSAAKEAFGPLMFKKKFKFRSPSINTRDKPKGFNGTQEDDGGNGTLIYGNADDNGRARNEERDGNGTLSNVNGDNILNQDEQIGFPNDDVSEDSTLPKPIPEPRNNLVKKSAAAKPRVAKAESGTTKDSRYDDQAVRAAKSEKSGSLEPRMPRGFGKQSQELDDSNRIDSVRGRKRGNRKSANRLGDKKSSSKTDFWWSSLPYVLGVLMQRGGNGEESEGLFTLRSTSKSMGDSSHTVAFEDRGDATNFCYLLESFFGDLDDFRTELIPIPTNELEDAVKSNLMKVLVVKKGQLQLYAGQPLTDVEMMMRSLIEQNDVP